MALVLSAAIETISSVVLMLLGLVVILALAYWVTKFIGKKYGTGTISAGHIKVIDRAGLGQDRMLYIVQVGDKMLLIGATPHSIETLCELSADSLPPLPDKQPSATSFADIFSTLKEKYKDKMGQQKEGKQDDAG